MIVYMVQTSTVTMDWFRTEGEILY